MIKLAPQQWQRLKDILGQALQHDTALARAEFVRRSCANDTELLHEAESLLAEAETILAQGNERLEDCANEATRTLRDDDARIGLRLGHYRIVSELGRGGMGAVYLGQRADGQFEKKVAIKILKRGTDTEEVLRRFRNERQILADLDHPNITRLLDAGTTEDGLPYFVMDYVSGQPIVTFAREHDLELRRRLALFLKVCSAVQFAHHRHVVHSDIKPSNVLVNDDCEPKLLDFGIAKLLDDSGDGSETIPAERRLTPQYASPEQIAGKPLTASTDIYSLGQLLRALIADRNDETPGSTKLAGALGAIIDRATAFDPQARFTTVEELTARTEAYLRDDEERDLRIAKRRPKVLYAAAALTVACLIVGAVLLKLSSIGRNPVAQVSPNHAQGVHSVAVLPFQALGEAAEDDLLGLGMADAVIGRLSSLKDVTVLPTSAITRFKSSQVDPVAAAKALGVNATLTGTVQRASDRVRISVQLMESPSRHILFAETYDEPFTDIFRLQDVLAERVARSLAHSLSPESEESLRKHATASTDAYEYYLAGLKHYNERTRDQLAAAIESFEKAVATDPHYAMAYALMADCYFLQFYYDFAPKAVVLPKASAATDRALFLDSSLAEGYLARSMFSKGKAMEADLQRALQLNPNSAVAHQRYAWHLCALGDLDGSLAEMRRAQELDPLSPTNASALATIFFFAHDYNEALRYAQRALELSPDNPLLHTNVAEVLGFLGRTDEAIAEFRRGVAIEPRLEGDAQVGVVAVLLFAGRVDEAARESEKLELLIKAGKVEPLPLAALYAAEGRKDEAFALFEQALKRGVKPTMNVKYDPAFGPLRADPRFESLLTEAHRRSLENEWSY